MSITCVFAALSPSFLPSSVANTIIGSINQPMKGTTAINPEIKFLKKDLRFKEKALAETAALLVLRKKLKAFYGEEPEDD